ncbi:MAG: hypothetical protein ACE5IL_01450 [Myxococcota bacterium]
MTGSRRRWKPERRWARGLPALAILLLSAGSSSAQTYDRLQISNQASTNGIFDPSVEYLPDGSVGWLFYSSVGGGLTPPLWGPEVSSRVARTTDHGSTWTFVQDINVSVPGVVMVQGSPVTGVWNTEVTSVTYDPDDPSREWKLFSHRLFRTDTPPHTNLVQFGWIVHRWASDPAGTWSPEVALFGSSFIPDPALFPTQVNINALDPSLSGILTYSEPGAFYAGGVLYLSLTGLLASGPDRIVLLASDDHGTSWRYVGAPVVSDVDMPPLGFLSFTGTSIVAQAGRVFLMGTPESPALEHDGTLVFEFEDLTTGTLRRQGGRLVVVRRVPPQPALLSVGFGGGQADFHEQNTAGGILMPQLDVGALPELFKIFETRVSPLDVAPVPALGPLRWIGIGLVLAVGAVGLRGGSRR